MSPLISKFARYMVQKAASDPEAREKMTRVAKRVAREAGEVARQDDRAYAAGKAFRRILGEVRGDR